ncbi:LPS export ABC transporter periplasmic protein LptC [Ancylobacter sp. 6x-1]|uniref:LPS export ABC transporter periplasmic protein LptC n=1 Tax=Ancylobacter crimeensis TaxID=2579147 RepID=A0ABT0DAP5_9HYPH|nr:LPS export ABC transporter periplasmic protein LptC [Ancylobacter crimeensis]MCK0197024.1 LPS export ABC transporter periplasmic protein LptC [Ancylobacter crimeensis]
MNRHATSQEVADSQDDPRTAAPGADAHAAAHASMLEGATSRAESPADFTSSRRHSRWVRLLRIALPVGVALGLAIAGGIAWFDPVRIAANLPVELGRVSMNGNKVVMDLPKLSGFTADNRGYNVTASTASQDLTNPDQIDLRDIRARLEMADQGWAKLEANSGQYNTKSQQMRLADGVHFSTASGYGGELKDADIDVKSGIIASRQPVLLTYLDGRLTADTMEVQQKDSRALFTGNVTLVFKLPPPGRKAGDPPPAEMTAPPPEGGDTVPETTPAQRDGARAVGRSVNWADASGAGAMSFEPSNAPADMWRAPTR